MEKVFLNVILGVQVIPAGLVKNGTSKVINYSVSSEKCPVTVYRYPSAPGSKTLDPRRRISPQN